MSTRKEAGRTRREFLYASLAVPVLFFIDGPLGLSALAAAGERGQAPLRGASPLAGDLEPTPACGGADEITPSQTAGPFYKPRSPERRSLIEPGMRGVKILLQGRVVSRKCKPITGALLDFWHADSSGVYDNAGYRLRGHQFTDDAGKYRLETIVPGLYPGRTRHFHVIVQVPGRPLLITQLYFPGEPENRSDWIFNPKLSISLRDAVKGKSASFDFVLNFG